MTPEDQKNAKLDEKASMMGCLVAIILMGALIFFLWPESDGKTREQRAQELNEFIQKRNRENAIREQNKIIYDEIIRENVRRSLN